MYVVTFYSFKGGVGRSMALVNVGAQLASAGKRVLLVDFDLEAPGLPTFEIGGGRNDGKGVVDFIDSYLRTGESPEVGEFLYEGLTFDNGGSIWIMPAGSQDEGYSSRLNSINWRSLYAEQDGYLLFEDLKRQWMRRLRPDYVLIDSRTGHSDVEGLCTRQLPDAVCMMFLPNDQNMRGLERVVENIRAQNNQFASTRKAIQLHFVASNVPDLDDEEQILARRLAAFESELSYKQLAALIHHYDSLSLLDQEIFSISRPQSKLAQEYSALATAIASGNLRDRSTALKRLTQARVNIRRGTSAVQPERLDDLLKEVLNSFSEDPEVLFRMALVYAQLGKDSEALDLLCTDQVDRELRTAAMFATRARLRLKLGQPEAGLEDMRLMLDAPGADFDSLLSALQELARLNPSLYERVPESRAFNSLSDEERLFFAMEFDEPTQFEAKVKLLERAADGPPADVPFSRGDILHELALCLISLGRPREALRHLNEDAPAKGAIAPRFNKAIALWALEGVPPVVELREIASLDASRRVAEPGANYLQCVGLVHALLGETEHALAKFDEADRALKSRPGREFSCWSYTKVRASEFREHLAEMRSFARGGAERPPFMRKPT